MFAIFRLIPEWNWYKLPKAYLEGPYLSSDNGALTSHFEQEGITVEQLEEVDVAHEEQGDGSMTASQLSKLPTKPKVMNRC